MMSPNVPLQAWVPDADPTTPGIIADARNVLPTMRGFAPDFGATPSATYACTLAAYCYGAFVARFSDGSTEVIAGTTNKLYRLDPGGAVTDVTGSSTPVAAYNATHRWCSWNAYVLNVNGAGVIRMKAAGVGQVFADVAGSPTAKTIATARGHILVGEMTGTSGWSYGDGWACSKLDDPSTWTPDIATGAARGRLTATPGNIVRFHAFRDYVLGFKNYSIYRGTYVGPQSNTFEWPVISTDIGLVAHDAMCVAADVLYLMSYDGIYRFDGSSLSRVNSAPWSWWTDQMGPNITYTQAQYDPVRRVVRFYCKLAGGPASVASAAFDFGVAYHPDTDRWGPFDAVGEWAVNVPSDVAPTPTSPSSMYARKDVAGFISMAHQLSTFTLSTTLSTITTGDIGSDDDNVVFKRARVRMLRAPTESAMQHFHRKVLSDDLTPGQLAIINDGKFDVTHSSRWHRAKFSFTGPYEILGFSVDAEPAGKR